MARPKKITKELKTGYIATRINVAEYDALEFLSSSYNDTKSGVLRRLIREEYERHIKKEVRQ